VRKLNGLIEHFGVPRGTQLQDGSDDQYVLLKIAWEIAAGAGDAATALQAAEKQAERFDVSAAKLKAETLLTAAREAATTAQHKVVAETALPIVGDLTAWSGKA
jgi:hypothetical protein